MSELREHERRLQDGYQLLDEANARVAGGGQGTPTSDELLDAATPALRYFENFLPVYHRVPPEMRANVYQVTVDARGIADRLFEHRGVDFTRFDRDAELLTRLAAAQRTEQLDLRQQLDVLYGSWTGTAAEKSRELIDRQSAEVEGLIGTIERTAATNQLAAQNVSQLLRDQVRWLLDRDSETGTDEVAGMTPSMIDVIIRCAKGEATETELHQVCSYFGIPVESGGTTADPMLRNEVMDAAADWLVEPFTAEVQARVRDVLTMCDDVRAGIEQQWSGVLEQLSELPGGEAAPADPVSGQPTGPTSQYVATATVSASVAAGSVFGPSEGWSAVPDAARPDPALPVDVAPGGGTSMPAFPAAFAPDFLPSAEPDGGVALPGADDSRSGGDGPGGNGSGGARLGSIPMEPDPTSGAGEPGGARLGALPVEEPSGTQNLPPAALGGSGADAPASGDAAGQASGGQTGGGQSAGGAAQQGAQFAGDGGDTSGPSATEEKDFQRSQQPAGQAAVDTLSWSRIGDLLGEDDR